MPRRPHYHDHEINFYPATQTATVACWRCHKLVTIPVTEEALDRWTQGELIQKVMPHLSPDQREVLISGTCGECFDALYKPPDAPVVVQ